MYSFICSYESANVVRVLKIGNADEGFFGRIALISNSVFAGSYVQEAVVINRELRISEWFGYRFFVFESS